VLAKKYSDGVAFFIWGLMILAFLFIVLYIINFLN